MAKLRFYAREGHDVPVPGTGGQGIPRLVGQVYSHVTKRQHPAAKPFECESTSDTGARLIKIMRRGDNALVCADDKTAAECGITFDAAAQEAAKAAEQAGAKAAKDIEEAIKAAADAAAKEQAQNATTPAESTPNTTETRATSGGKKQ